MQDAKRGRRDQRPVGNASGEAGGGAEGGLASEGPTKTTDRRQESALGGYVATRSGTAPTPKRNLSD